VSSSHLQLSDYHVDVPDSLIAQYPLADRAASRLMALNAGEPASITHHQFSDLPNLLKQGDLLVLNNTKVIPARLFGQKLTGGRVEILVERVLESGQLLSMVRSSKSPRVGTSIQLENGDLLTVHSRADNFFILDVQAGTDPLALLDQHGNMPLPPYITREPEPDDLVRYQTIYGEHPGAVAAPTAGLHFNQTLFDQLDERGVGRVFVTLHVGAGTFQPVRVENPEDHVMHAEYVEVSRQTADAVNETRARGGRIIAVGTTSVRCLESAARFGGDGQERSSESSELRCELNAWTGDTKLFLRPGSAFHMVDAMVTNFHLPRSTLMMLVSAFAGHQNIMQAYRCAVEDAYRFYSYGDAMLLWPGDNAKR